MFHLFEIRVVKMTGSVNRFVAKGQCSTCGVVAIIYMTDQQYRSLYRFVPGTIFSKLDPYFPKCPNCETKPK
jgi:hypothetical protein